MGGNKFIVVKDGKEIVINGWYQDLMRRIWLW
jgi:hypothetical protein